MINFQMLEPGLLADGANGLASQVATLARFGAALGVKVPDTWDEEDLSEVADEVEAAVNAVIAPYDRLVEWVDGDLFLSAY